MSKKRILDQINIDTDMFMTSFEKAAKLLLEQKNKLEQEGWTSIHLTMEYYNGGYSELIVMGMRLETDEEYKNRLLKETKELERKRLLQQRKEEREKRKYEELKKKYGS
jgi:hypothetical protein